MTNVMFSLSAVDVLEVLTEVDEKSRRSPEIIQYFIVSQKQNRRSSEAAVGVLMPVWLFTERSAETYGFIWGAVSEHGLQPGSALHPEQSQVQIAVREHHSCF